MQIERKTHLQLEPWEFVRLSQTAIVFGQHMHLQAAPTLGLNAVLDEVLGAQIASTGTLIVVAAQLALRAGTADGQAGVQQVQLVAPARAPHSLHKGSVRERILLYEA